MRKYGAIRFELPLGESRICHLESLRRHFPFHLDEVITLYQDGRLQKWTRLWGFTQEASALERVTAVDPEALISELAIIYQVPSVSFRRGEAQHWVRKHRIARLRSASPAAAWDILDGLTAMEAEGLGLSDLKAQASQLVPLAQVLLESWHQTIDEPLPNADFIAGTVSQDGRVVALSMQSEGIHVWQEGQPSQWAQIRLSEGDCSAMTLSAGGEYLAIHYGRKIHVISTKGMMVTYTLPLDGDGDCPIAIGTTGRRLVTGHIKGQVAVWSLELSTPPLELNVGTTHIQCLALGVADSRLAVVTDDAIQVWDIDQKRRKYRFPIDASERFIGVALSTCGTQVIALNDQNQVQVINTAEGRFQQAFEGISGARLVGVGIRDQGTFLTAVRQRLELWQSRKSPLCCLHPASAFQSAADLARLNAPETWTDLHPEEEAWVDFWQALSSWQEREVTSP